jgi:Cof subfamily protein (haloacid dehalogenase superfamily)
LKIKLVAIDIDGTLINDKREITNEVHEAIQLAKKQGIKIVITTGRPLTGVHALLEQLDLNGDEDFVITYNGGLVQKAKTGEELIRYTLNHDDYLEIELWARKLNVHMHSISNDAIYTANRDISPFTVHESFLVNMPIRYRTPEEMTEEIEIVKMMYIDEPEILTEAIQNLPSHLKKNYTTVLSSPFYFEFLNSKTSKGVALMSLAKRLNIQKEEIMAIGDAENDISMIQMAGFGVAMGNAMESVKVVADAQTASNNDNGIAVALKKWVLN